MTPVAFDDPTVAFGDPFVGFAGERFAAGDWPRVEVPRQDRAVPAPWQDRTVEDPRMGRA